MLFIKTKEIQDVYMALYEYNLNFICARLSVENGLIITMTDTIELNDFKQEEIEVVTLKQVESWLQVI